QEMVQAVAAGQVDVGGTSNTAAFYNAIARGVRQPFVCDQWHLQAGVKSNMVVLRPDLVDTIGQLSDLRGRPIAASNPIGDAGSAFIAKKMLEPSGLRLEDVGWNQMSPADTLAAFANRNLDAAWMFEPFITLGKQRDLLVPWLALGDYDPGAQIAG